MDFIIYDIKAAQRIVCNVHRNDKQGLDGDGLSSKMGTLFNNTPLLTSSPSFSNVIEEDTYINMGFGMVCDGEPIFMASSIGQPPDRLITFMYAYDTSYNVQFVLMDVNGDGQIDTIILRKDIDDMMDHLRCDSSMSSVSLLIDVTSFATPCHLFKLDSSDDIPSGLFVKSGDRVCVLVFHGLSGNPIQGLIMPLDYISLLKRGAKSYFRSSSAKKKLNKLSEKLLFANLPMFLTSTISGSESIFAVYDQRLLKAMGNVAERKEARNEHLSRVEERLMQSQVEEAEREKERRIKVAAMRKERKEREEVAGQQATPATLRNESSAKAVKAPPMTLTARERGLKQISIEQARQHKADLKEREEHRIAEIEKKVELVQIGDAIQKG